MDLKMGYLIFAQNFHARQSCDVKKLNKLQQDYMASFLRVQLNTLKNVLSSVENSDKYNEGYFSESMHRIEKNIHRFRKVCSN
ncbi:MAG: hypothetical protein KJ915_01730 [Candidatus Omnitrophica bacterium]|nr:hypothetical protein [Candidatus Omnitrophota bacterium]